MTHIKLLVPVLVLLSSVQAHFTVATPNSVGFNEDTEDKEPCGGIPIDLTKVAVTDFHVGGDYISTILTHPQSNWLYRGTLDVTASGGWTQLFPIIQQSGYKQICMSVQAPPDWVGKQGVIGIVSHTVDGILFQCSVVNFVDGTGTLNANLCTNTTNVEITYTSDDALSKYVGGGTPPITKSATDSNGTNTGPTPSATNTKVPGAASGVVVDTMALACIVGAGMVVLLGTALF